MNRQQWLIVISSLVLVCLPVAGAWAASSANFDLAWYVLADGGGHTSSTSYNLDGSIGQPVVTALSSADYRVGAGYWYGIVETLPVPTQYKLYLPLILKNRP